MTHQNTPKIAQDSIWVLKANLHKAKAALDMPSWRIVQKNIRVALIQEPWTI